MVQTYKMANDADSEQILVIADEWRKTRATTGTENLLKEKEKSRVQEQFFQLTSDRRMEQFTQCS